MEKISAWSRAKGDSNKWLHDHIVAWFLAFLLPGAGTMLATLLVPPNLAPHVSTLLGFLGGVAGLVLLLLSVYIYNFFRAPYKQRNEARQRINELESELEKPQLFDILCPTTSLGLPINRLSDGSYQSSSVGIGFKPLSILHRGELTTINRFTMSPRIIFLNKDKSWETTNAIKVMPFSNPLASPRARDFSWDTTNPDQWVLVGLPLTMAKDELLPLPIMSMVVENSNEVGSRIEKGEICILAMSFAIRTDKGFPPLPDQQISLTGSDIKDSLTKLGIQIKPEKGSTQ